MKLFTFIMAFWAVCSSAWGQKFKSGDLYYEITDQVSKTVSVTYEKNGDSQNYSYLSGTVTIPETVSYENEMYSVTGIGNNAFLDCSGLTSISLPSGLTNIEYGAFWGCSGLTSISLPSGLTSIGQNAFYECSGLTSISLPSGLTSIENYVFWGCSGLTSISLPAGLTSIGQNAFWGCSGLTSISLPAGLTSIGDYAFFACSSLTSITCPSGLTSIGNGAFSACSSLTSITFPSSLTSIGDDVFSDCSSLTSIEVESGSSEYLSDSGVLFNASKTELIAYPIAKQEASYTIPSSVTSIGDDAFSNCSSLTSITFPSGLTSIGQSAFKGCTGLTSISLPSGLTSIGDDAFSNCSSLTSITFPSGLTNIGQSAFYYCSGLTSITFPSGLTNIGQSAFRGCSGLTSISLPAGLTSIGNYVFYDCSGLTSITFPSGLTSIGQCAFYYCSSLTSITFPSGLTSIGGGAFLGCSSLTSISLPSSLTSIGYYAFRYCSQLSEVIVESVNPPTVNRGGNSDPDLGLDEMVKVYVPGQSLDTYHVTEGWKDLYLLAIGTEEPSSGELLVRSIGENISSLDGISGKPFALYNVGRKCYVNLGEYGTNKGVYVMSDNPHNRNTFVFTIEKIGGGKYVFRNMNGQYIPMLNTSNEIFSSDVAGRFEISASSDGKWIIKDPSVNLYFNGNENGMTFNGSDNGTDDNSKYEIREVDAVKLPLEISTIGEAFDENTHWYRMKIGGEYVRYAKDDTSNIPVSGATANDFDNYLWSFAKDVNGRYVIYNKAAGADKVLTSLPATANDIAVHLSDASTLGSDKNLSWDMYYSDVYPEKVGFCLGRKDDYIRHVSEQDGFLKFSEEKDVSSTLEIEAVENPSLYLSTNTFYTFRSQETGKYISSEPNGTGKHLMTDQGRAVEKTAFYISDDFRVIDCTGKYMKGGTTPESGSDTYRFILQADGETFYIKPSSTDKLYADNSTVDYWSGMDPRCNWQIEAVDQEELKASIRNSRPVSDAVGSLKFRPYNIFITALESSDASQIVEALRIANTPENLVTFNPSNYYRIMTSPKEEGWNGVVRYLTSAPDRLYGYDYNYDDISQIWNINVEAGDSYILESQGVYSTAPVAMDVDVTITKDKKSACRFSMTKRSDQISYGFKNDDMFLHLKKETIDSDKTINGCDVEEDACFWYLIEENNINLTVSPDGYTTFNYPFAVRIPKYSLEAYIVTKVTETTLILKPIGSVIPANTPVIISCPLALEEGASITYTLDILPKDYEAEDGEIAIQTDENLLSGTLLPETMSVDKQVYVLGKKTEIGFYRMDGTDRTIGANKAYLNLTGNTDFQYVDGMTFSFDDHDGSTTGMENIRTDSPNEEYYDLQGRRVVHPTRGIYVTKSGQKVLFFQ